MSAMGVNPQSEGASGRDLSKGAQAKVQYVAPVMEYVTANLTTGMVLELIVHLKATSAEYVMSEAVESFLGQLVESYPGDLPEGMGE